MKRLQSLLYTSLLVTAFCSTAIAGDITGKAVRGDITGRASMGDITGRASMGDITGKVLVDLLLFLSKVTK